MIRLAASVGIPVILFVVFLWLDRRHYCGGENCSHCKKIFSVERLMAAGICILLLLAGCVASAQYSYWKGDSKIVVLDSVPLVGAEGHYLWERVGNGYQINNKLLIPGSTVIEEERADGVMMLVRTYALVFGKDFPNLFLPTDDTHYEFRVPRGSVPRTLQLN